MSEYLHELKKYKKCMFILCETEYFQRLKCFWFLTLSFNFVTHMPVFLSANDRREYSLILVTTAMLAAENVCV